MLQIQSSIEDITKVRGKNREQKINQICQEILCSLNQTHQLNIDNWEINELFKTYNSTTRKIVKEIMNTLIKAGKIIEDIQHRTAYTFVNAEIGSNDYCSFEALMRANGYRKNKEVLLDNETFIRMFQTEEEIEEDREFTWSNSYKPISQQGCFSFGNKSFIKKPLNYPVKIYRVVN
jgi:hypothetical protein